jgi:prepilin-type processing-associated H-X9-DG protein
MRNSIGLACVILLFSSTAQAIDLGVGAKAGINGVGLDLSVGLTKNINARISLAAIDIEGEEDSITVGDSGGEGELEYDIDFDYGANALFVDWHVFGSGFRVSAGMLKNNGAAEGSSTLQGAIVIDGQNLDPSDFNGAIGTDVSLGESYQPYIGIGWGRGAGGDGGFSFALDVGVALLDTSVDFDASVNTGGTNGLNQAELDSILRSLEIDAEAELDDYELWPVLALGVNYAF